MEKIITVDGLASSGKSTLSYRLSKRLRWPWFSTGVLYRGMAYVALKEKFKEKDYLPFFKSKDWRIELTPFKSLFFYKDIDISSQLYCEEIDEKASFLSASPSYRKALIPFQRDFYSAEKGLILEGRDCGTILFPSAPLKVFLTAPEKKRAERRKKERTKSLSSILKAQRQRDERDQGRYFAPLIQAQEALCLDSSSHTIDNLVQIVYEKAQEIFFKK
ncbi:MAG: (d)CMP kinase [Bdellovibrionales bacterium]|nr:(d)CMP kinase [Bdellovibrionales bacterium]